MNFGFMSVEFWLVIIMIVLGFGVYSTHNLRGKVRCILIRPDLTLAEKFIKEEQRRISFGKGWFYINPKRIIESDWSKGIFWLFPTKVQTIIFRWDSTQALDPRDFNNDYEKPESRAALDKEEDIRAYSQGNINIAGVTRKQNMLERWMPLVTVGGFLLLGYLVYSINAKVDSVGLAINVLQKMMMGE